MSLKYEIAILASRTHGIGAIDIAKRMYDWVTNVEVKCPEDDLESEYYIRLDLLQACVDKTQGVFNTERLEELYQWQREEAEVETGDR